MQGQPHRAARPQRRLDRRVLALAAGTLLAALAWAALVYAGIRFVQGARGGEGAAWAFAALASLGAVACLFLALVLGARAARALRPTAAEPGLPPALRGGRRRRQGS